MAAGIEVSKATIALDLMREIGPGGSGYLTAEHTLRHLRGPEYYTPSLAVRGRERAWEAAGGKDTYALARAKGPGVRREARGGL